MKEPLHLAATMIVVLALAGCPSVKDGVNSEPQDSGKELYERGIGAFAAQRYGEGLALLETLAASYPQSPYAESGKQALQNCNQVKACASARAIIPHGGGMTFFECPRRAISLP